MMLLFWLGIVKYAFLVGVAVVVYLRKSRLRHATALSDADLRALVLESANARPLRARLSQTTTTTTT